MYIKPCKLPATIAARMKSRWTSAIAPAYFCAIALLGSRSSKRSQLQNHCSTQAAKITGSTIGHHYKPCSSRSCWPQRVAEPRSSRSLAVPPCPSPSAGPPPDGVRQRCEGGGGAAAPPGRAIGEIYGKSGSGAPAAKKSQLALNYFG